MYLNVQTTKNDKIYSNSFTVISFMACNNAPATVSMDDQGNPTAKGDFLQQMKNCYADPDKILKHYGCTFDDVVVGKLEVNKAK